MLASVHRVHARAWPVQPLQQAKEEIERGRDGKVDAEGRADAYLRRGAIRGHQRQSEVINAEGRADAYLCFEYLRGV